MKLRFQSAMAAMLVATSAIAFANLKVGDPVADRKLARYAGGEAALLQPKTVTAFMFISPEQQYSRLAVVKLAKLIEEFGDKPVHWVLLVSDPVDRERMDALLERTDFKGEVLIDKDNAFYGEVGAFLTPTTGVVGADGKLVAYLPFEKVNYLETIGAWVRRARGDIDDAQLKAILEPPKLEQRGSASEVARRYEKMGERMLKMEKWEAAEKAARQSLEQDAAPAGAHAVLGAALAGQGRCDAAKVELEQALGVDGKNEIALAGKARCDGKGSAAAGDAATAAGSADAGSGGDAAATSGVGTVAGGSEGRGTK